MLCPVCNHPDTRVVDSRMNPDGRCVRRRRECSSCEYRFSTIEEGEVPDINIVKRDGRREGYVREKVASGIRRALEKRSYTASDFQAILHAIERALQQKRVQEIRSSEVGDIVMDALKAFDKVAYIRFASVYRSFEDAESFQVEVRKLLRGSRKKKKRSRSRT